MKKSYWALAALLAVSFLSSCGSDTNIYITPPASEPVVTQTATPSETAIPENIPINTPESKTSAHKKGVSLESMTAAEKREVNLFLSNFSEASYGTYNTEETADKLHFAFIHNVINNKNFKNYVSGSEYRISADLVDATLKRFFGRSIPHKSYPSINWRYEGGYFYTIAADGDSVAYFTIAKNLVDNHNGTYTVQFDVFSAPGPHDPIDSSWYSLSHSQAISRFERLYSGTAVVKPKTHNGSATYELVDYNVK